MMVNRTKGVEWIALVGNRIQVILVHIFVTKADGLVGVTTTKTNQASQSFTMQSGVLISNPFKRTFERGRISNPTLFKA
jgi:hypothetical protein